MALIKCPECGKEVSSLAAACPVCAYPISANNPCGPVWIKLMPLGGKVQIINIDTKAVLWENRGGGEVARFEVDGPTKIGVSWGLLGAGINEESITCVKANERYEFKQVKNVWGIAHFKMLPVDVIDSDS